jgi:hypothetical protein
MYLINVWDREELLFKGKTETEPKIDKVVEHKFASARYRITYEDI